MAAGTASAVQPAQPNGCLEQLPTISLSSADRMRQPFGRLQAEASRQPTKGRPCQWRPASSILSPTRVCCSHRTRSPVFAASAGAPVRASSAAGVKVICSEAPFPTSISAVCPAKRRMKDAGCWMRLAGQMLQFLLERLGLDSGRERNRCDELRTAAALVRVNCLSSGLNRGVQDLTAKVRPGSWPTALIDAGRIVGFARWKGSSWASGERVLRVETFLLQPAPLTESSKLKFPATCFVNAASSLAPASHSDLDQKISSALIAIGYPLRA